MKNKKILVTIFILIITLLIGTINVKAASYEIGASKKTVEVGEEVTITVKFVAAAWNVKVSGNGITGASYASQTSDLSETETVKTFKLDTSKAGTYTITVSGDITDANGSTQDLNKSCTVTVNEKVVVPQPEPEQPTTPESKPETPVTPEQKPETPVTPPVEQKPEFKDTNKTMYASKDTIFLRKTWSRESEGTIVNKGTELTVTATSSNKVNGYVWYRVTYNGKTLYVASGLLTDKKPEKAEEPQQPVEEKQQETQKVEEQQDINKPDDETDIVKDGLQSLQIEGVTLSPTFSPEVYEYRTIIKENLSELVINAIPAVEGWAVTVAGNTNLSEGENLITLVVYNAEGNVEATYQITVNKNTLDLSETDNILKLGTKTARRNLIIFIAILIIVLIALIVVMVLRSKNQSDEEYDEEQEFTNNEENVENGEETVVEEEQVNEEDNQEEAQRPRRDKRKGKHF